MDNEGDKELEAIILLQEEPITSALSKWLAWVLVMVIFMMCLIYFSNYFAKSTECMSDGPLQHQVTYHLRKM